MNDDDYVFKRYESYIERELQEQADRDAMFEEYCKYLDSQMLMK